MQDDKPLYPAAFCKIDGCIYPAGEETAVSFREVARYFGTYKAVIHEHPSGEITRSSVRAVEARLVRLGKIKL
jgi:hypothetical protein